MTRQYFPVRWRYRLPDEAVTSTVRFVTRGSSEYGSAA